ncbi:3338_t:CDS:2, partial [Racocetra fulgida]
LSEALKKGVVEAGYRGELTARLLLLNAWDCCIKKKILDENNMNISKNYFQFVTLEEFLKSLLADNIYEKIKNRLEETVKFTGRKFSEAYIKDALIRGIAYSCKRNQRGADIIIPLYLGTLDEELNEDRISYILIQVKNHSTNNRGYEYLKSATTCL